MTHSPEYYECFNSVNKERLVGESYGEISRKHVVIFMYNQLYYIIEYSPNLHCASNYPIGET